MMMLASELKSHSVDKLKIRQMMAKLKVVHKWVGLGRLQSFMIILGRVGSNSHVGRVRSGQENWTCTSNSEADRQTDSQRDADENSTRTARSTRIG